VFRVVPIESGGEFFHADIRQNLASSGAPIGGNDSFIAVHALQQQATLVTDNVAELQHVPGLHIENWVRPV